MAEQFQLREAFNPDLVHELADNISNVWPSFDQKTFTDAITPKLSELNFGDRCSLIADTLHHSLPSDLFPIL